MLMNLRKLKLMVDRRQSPNYRQISGHIPIDMYRKFKSVCALRDVSQSEALEQAINIWMEQEEEENPKSIHEDEV
jgi:hypothetical protein